ncbi:MAG: hypothetical protein QOG62_2534 [Thermoleophilaceae bacterium]|nr:hypothetical protein [Thermoleophilaceae bacterium]
MSDLLVRRDDLSQMKSQPSSQESGELAPGEVRFAVERFGITANNLTYAVFGEEFGYWRFFPAPEGWGRVPVWGFGRVVESTVPELVEGSRFYGYWPMSTHTVMQPAVVPGIGFAESAAHRADLPPFYNVYLGADGNPAFNPEFDGFNAVLRPLFATGWLIAEQLEAAEWHGAGAVVLASASSKTAYSAAFEISRREGGPRVIGLTSPGNRDFTEALGFYDQVLTYDEAGSLPTDEGLVLVDMAGDPNIRAAVHGHAGDALKASITVGASHWDNASLESGEMPGPVPAFFFAPTVIEELAARMGGEVMQDKLAAASVDFIQAIAPSLEIEEASGEEAVERVFVSFVKGTADPRKGYVLSL